MLQRLETNNSTNSSFIRKARSIRMNNADQMILCSITQTLFDIYKAYWSREVKGKYTAGVEDEQASHDSLRGTLKFCRDFEIIPDTLTAKQAFLIWYTLCHYNDDEGVLDLSVMNESTMSKKLPFDKGIFWKLSHFSVFLFKSAIIANEDRMEAKADQTKQLLYFLRRLERSRGFNQIQKLTNRPMNSVTTLLPDHELLADIFGEATESDLTLLPTFLENERAVSAILSQNLSEREKSTILRERLRGDQEAKKRLELDEEAENFLEQTYDDIKRVFEIYSSMGDPLNTQKLKSAKALRMIKDCKLLKAKYSKPYEISEEQLLKYRGQINYISSVQLDLIFTNLTSNPHIGVYDTKEDPMNLSVYGSSNQKSMYGGKSFHQASMNQTVSRYNTSMFEQSMSKENHTYQNCKGKMDFEHFLKFLQDVASKIFVRLDKSKGFTYLVADFIIPLLSKHQESESRCIQNNQILDLVTKLEDEQMVEFLTILH